VELPNGAVIATAQALTMGKMLVELNHRWHEKYLVADGNKAIVGGLNIADEYMFGGTDRKIISLGTERPAWRDTDLLMEGPAANDVYNAFAKNWLHLTGETMEEIPVQDTFENGQDILMVQHRPRIDGDHHITNAMVESIKALRPGEKCWISSAYFIPTGALELLKDVLCDAAKRGVDVRILTNGGPSSDAPVINQAAIQSYRELADAGVMVMEKNGTQTIHSKTAVMGSHLSFIGSWNGDNRSASLNSEDVAIVFDDALAKEMEDSFLADSAPESVSVVNDAWFDELGWLEQLKGYGLSLFANLM
jgi:cardiolipin synthase